MEFFKLYMGKYAACIPIMGIIISKIGKNSVTSFGILISKIKYYHGWGFLNPRLELAG